MREESQHRDVRRMTNVVSRAITGPQINSLSKFIVHLPSASCHKPCNMTPLKFVLTSTPGGLSSLPPTIPTNTHTHTHPLLLLFANGAGGATYAKKAAAVCQQVEGGPPLGVITTLSILQTLTTSFKKSSTYRWLHQAVRHD